MEARCTPTTSSAIAEVLSDALRHSAALKLAMAPLALTFISKFTIAEMETGNLLIAN